MLGVPGFGDTIGRDEGTKGSGLSDMKRRVSRTREITLVIALHAAPDDLNLSVLPVISVQKRHQHPL